MLKPNNKILKPNNNIFDVINDNYDFLTRGGYGSIHVKNKNFIKKDKNSEYGLIYKRIVLQGISEIPISEILVPDHTNFLNSKIFFCKKMDSTLIYLLDLEKIGLTAHDVLPGKSHEYRSARCAEFLEAQIFLESYGFIHCDLKLENIIFYEDKLKIIDFGLKVYN